MNDDPRKYAPATARNREPILHVLERVVSAGDRVLEIASGSGEHGVFLAPKLGAIWQPSDPDPEARASIDAHVKSTGDKNILPALALDVTEPPSSSFNDETEKEKRPNIVVCINMIHIAPWKACEGLLDTARALHASVLYLYGPFKRGGRHTAPSNEAFDQDLRSRNPEWGVRDLDDVAAAASERDFELAEVIEMPANNLSVVFRSRSLRNG